MFHSLSSRSYVIKLKLVASNVNSFQPIYCYKPLEPEFYVEFDFPGSKSLMITEQVKNNVTFFYNKKAETWLNENNVNFLYYFFLKF